MMKTDKNSWHKVSRHRRAGAERHSAGNFPVLIQLQHNLFQLSKNTLQTVTKPGPLRRQGDAT